MRSTLLRIFLLLQLSVPTTTVFGRVVRVEVVEHRDVLNGRWFGLAGPYEILRGKIYFAIDPANSANRIITDIERTARNERGEVEFSADFYLMKPVQMKRANGALLFEVSNRGRKYLPGFYSLGSSSLDPREEEHFGDGYLLREGYVLLWVGWQFDVPRESNLMRLYPPGATENGKPIRGLVRSNFVVTQNAHHHSLADRNHIAYAAVDAAASENVMTVRDAVDAPPRIIPRSDWKFARRLPDGAIVDDPTQVYLKTGLEPGKVYEVVYVSEGPPLVGLGPAAVRDAVAFLKNDGSSMLSIPEGSIHRAIAHGSSQSGRFLRTFLYYGFNEDEMHRRVFDGMIAHVAGAGRGSFNHRFAQPSRDAHPYMNFFYPTDIFPFTDAQQTDPQTAMTDGVLTHRLRPEFWPKIFYTNSAYEYWGRAASLIHTTVDGKRDAPILDNARIYFFAGSQHGPASFPPGRSIGQQHANPTDFRWSMRALLKAMDRWIAENQPPPPSRYPRIDQGTLVAPEKLNFPSLPGVHFSSRVHKAYRVDYGPKFRTEGIITQEPPKIGSPYPILVPAVDRDGNETSGIRLPELAVPLATYTGWNLFNAESGPTHEISSMVGSYIPLNRTKTEREARQDPRPSIEERYQNREHYLGLVSNAAQDLINQGYLLKEDLSGILRSAGRHWDYLAKGE